MLILSVHPGYHDACVVLQDEYDLLSAVAMERVTRIKTDGGRWPTETVSACLGQAQRRKDEVDVLVLTRGAFLSRYFKGFATGRRLERVARRLTGTEKHKSMEREMLRAGSQHSEPLFDAALFLKDHGFRADCQVHFVNHHECHALPCLFHTDWPSDALLYTADGGGDNVQYSARHFDGAAIHTLFGGDEAFAGPAAVDSLGLAYGFATQACGWKINRHEGKLTGLAARGTPRGAEALAAHFTVEDDGRITSDFASNGDLRAWIKEWSAELGREDTAASAQKVLEDKILEAVERLLAKTGARYLGLSGGVFGNVLLNQKLAEKLPVDEVFIYPAMSDQGLAAGGALLYLLARDGLTDWLAARKRFEHLYLGQDYRAEIDMALSEAGARKILLGVGEAPPAITAASLIHSGKAGAIYSKGMEHGPRALGARSILAAPVDATINETLNARLDRSEFMPFAPVIQAEHANRVFDIGPVKGYAARFMTITCFVQPEWRDKIPAVVHVDGTARPQVIERDPNPLYFDILGAYGEMSGIPVLINTSFNAHEEPIINSPKECADALVAGRVDFVVTDWAVWEMPD
ncbi:MAG: carbamoyltransferase C-terminal domain-containing protein [Rhodospirillaceae bacterium]